MSSYKSKKSVSFCFRGFQLTPEYVEKYIGIESTKKGRQGELARLGTKSLLKRSFVLYSKNLPDSCRLDEIVPAITTWLGGVDHLCKVREHISPEFCEVDITLHVKNSEEQEGGFFPPSTLAELSRLNATLSFQFL